MRFPKLPGQPGYRKRRARCSEQIDWPIAMFARDSPGRSDSMVLIDSTPVECGRSVDTARRSAMQPACAHHYSRSHSRWF
ncbi:MAG: IS982 family transposase, partial [Solirubrobacteraceae bacterium]|nr:IS982 family transposase [Solirubrobacteraceae bacterium]